METIPLAAFALIAVAVCVIAFLVLSEKGEKFDSGVEENQGCLVMCQGIGYSSFVDLAIDDCLALNKGAPGTHRFMRQQNTGLENGCCCVNQ